ncbi:MAG: cell division protein ZapA [Sphaerotilus sp.]|jgi:cell division protein ZapA|nr:cell division protein ZapA [Sphaerotilus sp.]
MKHLDVSIMGQRYILACPDGGEAALTAAARQVDREMCAIRDAGRVKARERIAVLAALNLAYSLIEQRARDGYAAPVPTAEVVPATAPTVPLITIDVDGLVRRIEAALGDQDHTPA